MNKFATLPGLVVLSFALAGCAGLEPSSPGPNRLIATNHDTGIHPGPLLDGHAAIAYDPDGCQGWIMDDGAEGYSGRRFDPKTGLPVCNNLYPPGTVLGDYQAQAPGFTDWTPIR
ncbi:MAG: hypothetical protein ABIV25_03745 [Paracoccaceae bacterium]